MKSIMLAFSLFITMQSSLAQNTTVEVSTAMLDTSHQVFIAGMDGWIFKEGNDAAWAKIDADVRGWRKFKPTQLSVANANASGKMEGWFRLKIRLDSTFNNIPLGLMFGSWASSDLYIDGKFIQSFGSTGAGSNPYQRSPVRVTLELNKDHLIAIHLVDDVVWFQLPKHLKSGGGVLSNQQNLESIISITAPEYNSLSLRNKIYNDLSSIVVLSICSTLSLLFWLLLYLNPLEKNLLVIAVVCTLLMVTDLTGYLFNTFSFSYSTHGLFGELWNLFTWTFIGSLPICISQILLSKVSRNLHYFFAVSVILGFFNFFTFSLYQIGYAYPIMGGFTLISICLSAWRIILAMKTMHGAQWSIVVGLLITALGGLLWFFSIGKAGNITNSIAIVSFPVALLVYVAIRFKEIIKEVRENAKQVVLISEEKRVLLAGQNAHLEKQVAERTSELNQSLQHLQSTQSQLIQSEKMASLGELTAGIAHEIQNPLNFVNNFSEVNKELIDETSQDVKSGNQDEAIELLSTLKGNEEKINHHGKRADAIVKGMLQHSRSSTGVTEAVDINALADEYLRLVYHGLRAKDNSFNAIMKTDFDNAIGKINIVPQDIGRVLLNLYNNAFYAVTEKKKTAEAGDEPTVSVSTKKTDNKITISVKDNGNGIPLKAVDKIFQPFFTTKPTGQGTGLGLSLSYDIIKAHGGEIKVETKEGEGSMFIIQLPIIV
jgi:two-component system NtrC family sensor kinase